MQDATVEIKNKENGNMRRKLLVHKSFKASCGVGRGHCILEHVGTTESHPSMLVINLAFLQILTTP